MLTRRRLMAMEIILVQFHLVKMQVIYKITSHIYSFIAL